MWPCLVGPQELSAFLSRALLSWRRFLSLVLLLDGSLCAGAARGFSIVARYLTRSSHTPGRDRPWLCGSRPVRRLPRWSLRHLTRLLRSEPEEMVVRRLTQRPRGGSGNNPFLKPNRTQMEYTVLIEPQSIARKIMTVRRAYLLCVCVARTTSLTYFGSADCGHHGWRTLGEAVKSLVSLQFA